MFSFSPNYSLLAIKRPAVATVVLLEDGGEQRREGFKQTLVGCHHSVADNFKQSF